MGARYPEGFAGRRLVLPTIRKQWPICTPAVNRLSDLISHVYGDDANTTLQRITSEKEGKVKKLSSRSP